MTDRVVRVVLRGDVSGLVAGMHTASRAVRETAGDLTAADKRAQEFRSGLTTVGRSAGAIGLVAAAGLAAVVAASANFDQAMSKVQAATHESAVNMDLLREAAIKAGAETVYSASEAAEGIEALAKAGVSTADILGGGLDGALALAASDGIAVGDAAEYAASAMTQFGLAGEQVTHIADLLAAGAGKAQGGVADLGQALNQSGLVAAQTGLTIEETVGALAEFASAGLIGSDAGTSFKTMLQALNPSSEQAADLMKKLGISAYDAQGNFVGMTQFAGILQDGLRDLSVEQQNAALKTIFGSDAVRAAAIIFKDGAEGVAEWQGKVDDAGYAAETAALRLDNLKGDLEAFKGSLETALIGAGDGAQGPLRELVQGATDVVNAFNSLPGPVQSGVTALLGITAVTGGALWLGASVVGKIAATRAAMDTLGVSAVRTRAALSGLVAGGAVVAGIAAIGIALHQLEKDDATPSLRKYTDAFGDLESSSKDATKTIEGLFDASGTNAALLLGHKNSINGIQDAFEKLNASDFTKFGLFASNGFGVFDTEADLATQAVEKADAALAGLVANGNVDAAQAGYELLAKKAKEAGLSTDELAELLPNYTTAAGAAVPVTQEFSEETTKLAAASGLGAEQVDALTTAMQEQTKAALGAFDAETQYRQALVDAREQAATNSAGLKGDTEEVLKNRGALGQLAAAWNGQSDAVKGNIDRYRDAKRAFIETATAMGVPIEQARRLAKRLLELPPSKTIPVTVDTSRAMTAVKNLQDYINGLTATVDVNATTGGARSYADALIPGKPKKKAAGGPVWGAGSATSDSIPAMLSNGEFVVQASAVDYYGLDFFAAANQRRLAGGSPGGDAGRGGGYGSVKSELREYRAALRLSTAAITAETTKRDDLISQRDDLISTLKSAFTRDLFGDRDEGFVWKSPADRKQALVGDPMDILRADIANGQAFQKQLSALKSKGLDGAAYAAIAQSGDLDRVTAFAGLSKVELAKYEQLFNQRAQVANSVGNYAGSAAFGADIRSMNAHLKAMNARQDRLEHIEKSLESLARKNPQAVGAAVARAINGAAPKRRA